MTVSKSSQKCTGLFRFPFGPASFLGFLARFDVRRSAGQMIALAVQIVPLT